jgi:hypothetical protein
MLSRTCAVGKRTRACNHAFKTNLRHNVKLILKNTKQRKLSLPAPLAYLFIGPSERIQRLNQRIFRRLSI